MTDNKDVNKYNNNVLTLIFSKNRPLQLDLTINTYYRNCLDSDDSDIFVLYKADEDYKDSYETLKNEHFGVNFVEETIFNKNVVDLLNNKKYEYVLFVVDDCIFINEFRLKVIKGSLEANPEAIGLSLRLGINCDYCYPLERKQLIPEMEDATEYYKYIKSFDWESSYFDFNYPLELSSSIYKTSIINVILDHVCFSTPNNLEGWLYQSTRVLHNIFCQKFTKLLCYETSRAFCTPLNRVQDTHKNRASINNKYSPENMLEVFKSGFRIDPCKSFELPNACHQEIELF